MNKDTTTNNDNDMFMSNKKDTNENLNQKYKNGLFIFHRDFRIEDNRGIIRASSQCEKIYTCFIFNPEQVDNKNEYRSQNSIQFMIESLEDLHISIKNSGGSLLTFYGKYETCIRELVEKLHIDCVFFNKDYSPFALNRTATLQKVIYCPCIIECDYYLYEPGTIINSSGGFFKKYTPFYEEVLKHEIKTPVYKRDLQLSKPFSSIKLEHRITLKVAMRKFVGNINAEILVRGGRKEALERLKRVVREQKEYDENRDYFIYETTFLSAYIKFGCVSVREVFQWFKKVDGLRGGLIRELIWREFFAHILYNYPEVVGQSYYPKYRSIRWRKSDADFYKWCIGGTGFPAVDAGMRQMNASGYMHNRLRMVVANFLVKTLLLDWRRGEKYFSEKLTDIDIASNNGNWQSIASTGVYATPYFRDMNPWIQCAKFDKKCEFIKKWIPELKDVQNRDIHKWYEKWTEYKTTVNYPKPMVEYAEQKEKMLELYRL
jgi:deoxyribodipyrimidine photo-lyase